jgi:hypothetical protein
MNQGRKQLKCKPRGRPWPKGVSGNPAGRPKGSLNKLSLAVKNSGPEPKLDPLKPFALSRQEGQEDCYLQDGHSFKISTLSRYDPRRGHAHTSHRISGAWRRTVEQDGQIFDRDTGVLLCPL